MDGAEQSLAATRSAEAASNATLAITEASNTAWRARQTAQAESAAEQQAMGASEVAGQSRSVRAYNAELAAAQSYNMVSSGAMQQGFSWSLTNCPHVPCAHNISVALAGQAVCHQHDLCSGTCQAFLSAICNPDLSVINALAGQAFFK